MNTCIEVIWRFQDQWGLPMERIRFVRLEELRTELDSLAPQPWSNIETWTAKATAIIRHGWSAYFDDFREVTQTPQWTALPVALGRNKAENDAEVARVRASETSANNATAERAKERILSFLDGLLALADESDAGEEAVTTATSDRPAEVSSDPRKVFVVHGRNGAARDALFSFLRAIGLHPLEWSEMVRATDKGAPFIGEVLETGFALAKAVVVLMTPDDEARLAEPFRTPEDEESEAKLTPQPRPNVLIEAGMALGLFPDRTIVVEVGRIRPASDLFGRHTIRMDNSTSKRQDLADRLETAGCAVSLRGRDWHCAGDFEKCIPSKVPVTRGEVELVFRNGVYYEKDADGNPTGSPYCPTCYERDNKRLHLTHAGHPFPHKCATCGAVIEIDKGDSPPGFAASFAPI